MSNKNKNKSNTSKPQTKSPIIDTLVSKKSTAKYFFKSEKNLGFKKRNFFLPGTNKRYLIEAGAEVDEKTYILFGEYCQKIFFED